MDIIFYLYFVVEIQDEQSWVYKVKAYQGRGYETWGHVGFGHEGKFFVPQLKISHLYLYLYFIRNLENIYIKLLNI